MGDVFKYNLVEQRDGSIKILYYPSPIWIEASPLTAALATEHAMSLTLSLSGYLSGKLIKPVNTSFCHEIESKYQAPFKDFFGNTAFGKRENSLEFDAATAGLPCISANQLMYEKMLSLCAEKMKNLEGHSSYTNKVLQILNSKQAYYNPKIEEVAAKLNISARTLQRKLKDEKQTYQQLLEEYQVETATQLLAKPNTQVQEVAFLLGFTSLQSFSRAFKRKTGMSPTQAKVVKDK
jgi:AraC-like DNA-binding protein